MPIVLGVLGGIAVVTILGAVVLWPDKDPSAESDDERVVEAARDVVSRSAEARDDAVEPQTGEVVQAPLRDGEPASFEDSGPHLPKGTSDKDQCAVLRSIMGPIAPDGQGGFTLEFTMGGGESAGPFLCVVVKSPGDRSEESITPGSFIVTGRNGTQLKPETVVVFGNQAKGEGGEIGEAYALEEDEVMLVFRTQLSAAELTMRWVPVTPD